MVSVPPSLLVGPSVDWSLLSYCQYLSFKMVHKLIGVTFIFSSSSLWFLSTLLVLCLSFYHLGLGWNRKFTFTFSGSTHLPDLWDSPSPSDLPIFSFRVEFFRSTRNLCVYIYPTFCTFIHPQFSTWYAYRIFMTPSIYNYSLLCVVLFFIMVSISPCEILLFPS